MTRISHAFDGTGTMTDQDADNTQDVSAASDSTTGGHVTLGYGF